MDYNYDNDAIEITGETYNTDFDDIAFEPEKVADESDSELAERFGY